MPRFLEAWEAARDSCRQTEPAAPTARTACAQQSQTAWAQGGALGAVGCHLSNANRPNGQLGGSLGFTHLRGKLLCEDGNLLPGALALRFGDLLGTVEVARYLFGPPHRLQRQPTADRVEMTL